MAGLTGTFYPSRYHIIFNNSSLWSLSAPLIAQTPFPVSWPSSPASAGILTCWAENPPEGMRSVCFKTVPEHHSPDMQTQTIAQHFMTGDFFHTPITVWKSFSLQQLSQWLVSFNGAMKVEIKPPADPLLPVSLPDGHRWTFFPGPTTALPILLAQTLRTQFLWGITSSLLLRDHFPSH